MINIQDEISDRSKGGKGPESTKLLGGGIKGWWLLLVRPIENYLIDNKFHPNVLTITTLIVSVITGIFFYYGLIFLAGVLLLAGSTLTEEWQELRDLIHSTVHFSIHVWTGSRRHLSIWAC